MSDTQTTAPTRIEPPVSEAAAPFWEATKEQKLVLQWCPSCSQVIHYPRFNCPSCLSMDLEWRPASGKGEIETFSVVHVQANPFQKPPYTVGLVRTEEGARMMTNIVGIDPDDVKVGAAVQVTWEPLSDGRHLPLWEPRS